MNYKKIVVAGGGVLGSQIAFQSAFCGFDVTIWLRSEGSIGRTQPKIDVLKKRYYAAIESMEQGIGWSRGISEEGKPIDAAACKKKTDDAYANLKYELDLRKAVEGADLVIECMAEDEKEKIAFYQKLAPLLDEKTVLVTNSSTLLPSTFAPYTGRADKFLSLHFANEIWMHNSAEIMAQDKTDMKYFDEVVEFAKAINMIALPVRKEKNGYLLNSLLVPFLLSAMDLYANGVSDPASIDMAWKLGTGAPKGPFEIYDIVGIQTAYNVGQQYSHVPEALCEGLKKLMLPYNFKGHLELIQKMVDEGRMGRDCGKGFYDYDK